MSISPFPKRTPSRLRSDPELWLIVAYNLGLVLLYLRGDQQPLIIVYGYYVQSLFVGLTHVTQALISGGRHAASLNVGRAKGLAGGCAGVAFFSFHYGFFHLVYAVFLFGRYEPGALGDWSLAEYLKLVAGFALFEYVVYVLRELWPGAPDRHTPMIWFAYLRVVPIHLFILLGAFFAPAAGAEASKGSVVAFLVFVALKSIGDVVLYVFAYRGKRDIAERSVGG